MFPSATDNSLPADDTGKQESLTNPFGLSGILLVDGCSKDYSSSMTKSQAENHTPSHVLPVNFESVVTP